MLNRRMFIVLAGALLLAACGGGGSGGGDGSRALSFEGSLDIVAMDMSGGQRSRPGAIGALEAN